MAETLLEERPAISSEYVDSIISFNVRMLLAAQKKSQTALGDVLGIKRSAISQKMTGKNTWSATDLVNTAQFLGTGVSSLLDDSLMRAVSGMQTAKAGNPTIDTHLLDPDGAPRRTRTDNPRLKRTLL